MYYLWYDRIFLMMIIIKKNCARALCDSVQLSVTPWGFCHGPLWVAGPGRAGRTNPISPAILATQAGWAGSRSGLARMT